MRYISAVFCLVGVLGGFLNGSTALANPNQAPESYVDLYLKQQLNVTDIDKFNLSKQLWKKLMAANGQQVAGLPKWRDVPLVAAARDMAVRRYFSRYSAEAVGQVFRALTAPSVANALVTGPAGVGKSYLMNQLALLISFQIIPEYLADEIGVPKELLQVQSELSLSLAIPSTVRDANQSGASLPYAGILNAFFGGHPELYIVNRELLRKNPGDKGDAYLSVPQRMAGVIEGLFAAATREFHRTDTNGRRTIFVFEEVATLDAEVQQLLKPLIERSGLRNPNDPLAHSEDSGYHVIAITTDDERKLLARGDGAVERRYRLIRLTEISEEQGFQLLKEKMASEYRPFSGMTVSDESLRYIIHMRKFFDNPPQAMPANILKALEDLYSWAMHRRNRPASGNTIGLREAQSFLKDRLGLSDLWFQDPPLSGLAAAVKQIVSGQDDVVDQIAAKIVAWARLGFRGEVPVFFLGGPSGSGKDTIFAAFNLVLFGHEGFDFQFDVAGQEGFGLTAILKGPPLGNHADDELPLLAQALDQGLSSMVALNEVQDIESGQMEQLKKTTETGEIRPQGKDSRMRKIYFPFFIMGQWGEYLFNRRDTEGRYTSEILTDDDEIEERYNQLSQAHIDRAFTEGKRVFGQTLIDDTDPRYGRFGAVPHALLQRARMTGGVHILRRVPVASYPRIVQVKFQRFQRNILMSNDFEVTASPELIQFIADVAEHSGEGTRGLHSTMMDYTEKALSEAMNLGLPPRGQRIHLHYERQSGVGKGLGHQIRVTFSDINEQNLVSSVVIDARSLRSIKMTCRDKLLND